MIATLTGAFYILLPQLANVDDSIDALRSANWLWLAGALVMSALTYVLSAVGLLGGVATRLPFVTTVEASLASSFVNRVTPANVGGMALNVRYMQKAGVPPAEAVTGIGLNVVAGGIVHVGLLVGLLRVGRPERFDVVLGPGRQQAARRHRRGARRRRRGDRHAAGAPPRALTGGAGAAPFARRHRVAGALAGPARPALRRLGRASRSPTSRRSPARWRRSTAAPASPRSAPSTSARRCIAAAAPTPGGLGAIEAALVAGLTGVGMDPAIAVAAVLSYRLVTYWLPILPGWLSFRRLDRRGYI